MDSAYEHPAVDLVDLDSVTVRKLMDSTESHHVVVQAGRRRAADAVRSEARPPGSLPAVGGLIDDVAEDKRSSDDLTP